jgi:hypothetical protein
MNLWITLRKAGEAVRGGAAAADGEVDSDEWIVGEIPQKITKSEGA